MDIYSLPTGSCFFLLPFPESSRRSSRHHMGTLGQHAQTFICFRAQKRHTAIPNSTRSAQNQQMDWTYLKRAVCICKIRVHSLKRVPGSETNEKKKMKNWKEFGVAQDQKRKSEKFFFGMHLFLAFLRPETAPRKRRKTLYIPFDVLCLPFTLILFLPPTEPF